MEGKGGREEKRGREKSGRNVERGLYINYQLDALIIIYS